MPHSGILFIYWGQLIVYGLFLGFNNDNFCINSILSNGFNAILAASHSLVTFTSSDNLTIGSLQAETELASLVLVNLEFRMLCYFVALNGLVFDSSLRSVGDNTGNTFTAIFFCLIYLGGRNNLAIASL